MTHRPRPASRSARETRMAKTKAKPKTSARPAARPSSNKPQPRNDAYTLMLFVTFVAIVTGCILLYLDFDEYGQQKAPTTQPPAMQKLGGDDSTTTKGTSTTPVTNP